MLIDVDEIWQGLVLHGIHIVGSIDPDRCMGGSRPNDKDFAFFPVILKMCHNSSYIQCISALLNA